MCAIHHAVALLAVASAAALTPAPEHFDVLVVGANAAGVAAAVTASDGNRYSVKVVEPLEMIGGMAAAGGVALMNQGGCGLTGLSRNWSMLCGEVRAHMQLPTPSPWLAEQRALAHSLGDDKSAVQHTPTVSTEERWKRSEEIGDQGGSFCVSCSTLPLHMQRLCSVSLLTAITQALLLCSGSTLTMAPFARTIFSSPFCFVSPACMCSQYYYGYPTLMTPVHAPFPSMNVSEWAFWTLLRSRHSINVSTGCRATAVTRDTADTGRLGRVDFLCANDTESMSISASYIIDATYDGDIMTMAGGIDYTSGREPRFACLPPSHAAWPRCLLGFVCLLLCMATTIAWVARIPRQ
jgi:hypothetical protein